ncbi:MAG TPA: hypothetical protein PLZ05_00485 [Alphaproteobacteria bacterium]|nr:hypothetical protein [Alphaproteobacteria bacterium]
MNNKIIAKSFLIWLGIIPLAFINGGLREFVLIPNFGKIGLPISAVILGTMIFLMSYIFIPKLGNASKETFVKIGIYWATATVFFEILIGILGHKTAYEIFSQYNIITGNLWTLVILYTAFVPFLTAKKRKIISDN